MKEVYFKIKGRVQGVGFRRFVVQKAHEIGLLSGWVRNAEDGSVEVLVRGDVEDVERLILFCHQGPLWARVDEVLFLARVTNGFLPLITDGIFESI